MASFLTRLKIDPADFKKISVIAIILTNLIPIYGVLFMGWQVFPVMLLFWIENVIIGVSNVFKMFFASPANVGQWVAKFFMIPFFCFHYGLFTLVHGLFIFVLFGGFMEGVFWLTKVDDVFGIIANQQIGWAILALILSHTLSFVTNYIGKGEYKKSTVSELMSQPYGRVVILHITIIFSGFLVMELGSPVVGLVLLIILKTFVDIKAHLKQHGNVDAPKKEIEMGVISGN
jgi:hypothetical protein